MLSLIIIGARFGLAIQKASFPYLSSKSNTVFHGIDFKNPFTMSKKEGRTPRYPPKRNWCLHHLENVGSVRSAPSVLTSVSLSALFDVGSNCVAHLVAGAVVEPIGIEPMT